jgi:hypothetical protein
MKWLEERLTDLARISRDPEQRAALIALGVLLLAVSIDFLQRSCRGKTDRAEEKRLTYRTSNGLFKIAFLFKRRSAGWRVYVESLPPYASYSRDESLHATHRLRDGLRYYICWTSELPSFEQAKSVARLWSERTSDYLLTGQRF